MSFLFVDQSSNANGIALFDKPYSLIMHNVIDLSKMPKSTDEDQANKRYELLKQISEIVFKNQVKLVSTEGVYFHSNAETHRKLSQVQGSLQDWCRSFQIICFSWKCAGEWRKWISIKAKDRKTYKAETKKYVIEKYGLPDNLSEDEYDAIAMGDAYFVMLELNGIG